MSRPPLLIQAGELARLEPFGNTAEGAGRQRRSSKCCATLNSVLSGRKGELVHRLDRQILLAPRVQSTLKWTSMRQSEALQL